MKDKDRITAMVCTSSDGVKCPIGWVGKSKNPRCFTNQNVQNYIANEKAWFNKGVTQWWFRDVFDPFFKETYRRGEENDDEAHCIVILDGCSAHVGIQEYLDSTGRGYIHVIKLPPNVTSRFQPMDQGVIAWVKKTYKYRLISELLVIYCDDDKFAEAVATRRNGGYDGIAQARKPHVYDAIVRINEIWDALSQDSVIKCWRKADCMPPLPPDHGDDGDGNDEGDGGVGGGLGDDGTDEGDDDGDDGDDGVGGGFGDDGNDDAFDDNDLNLQLAEGLTSLRDCVRNMGNAEVTDEFAGTFIADETNIVDAVDVVEAWNSQEASETTDAFAFEQVCDVAASDALVEAEKVFADMMAREQDFESEEGSDLEDNDDVEGSDCEDEGKSAGDMDSSSGSGSGSDEDEDIVDERLLRATPAKIIQIMEEQCEILSRTSKFALESGKFDNFPYADKCLKRVEQLGVAYMDTMNLLQVQQDDMDDRARLSRTLGKRQSGMNDFFTKMPKKK